ARRCVYSRAMRRACMNSSSSDSRHSTAHAECTLSTRVNAPVACCAYSTLALLIRLTAPRATLAQGGLPPHIRFMQDTEHATSAAADGESHPLDPRWIPYRRRVAGVR